MVLRWNWLVVLILSFSTLSLTSTSFANKTLPKLSFKTKKIQVGSKIISVELAETPEQHERGLMFRKSLPENSGMLFLFKESQTLNFWMKNTLINLSIAYIDKNKSIIDIQEMKVVPVTELYIKNYPSRLPAQYALEMNAGWFNKNRIKVGDKVVF